MEILKIDKLKNTFGWVSLDKRSLTMCFRFKTSWSSTFGGFFWSDIRSAPNRRLMASDDLRDNMVLEMIMMIKLYDHNDIAVMVFQ